MPLQFQQAWEFVLSPFRFRQQSSEMVTDDTHRSDRWGALNRLFDIPCFYVRNAAWKWAGNKAILTQEFFWVTTAMWSWLMMRVHKVLRALCGRNGVCKLVGTQIQKLEGTAHWWTLGWTTHLLKALLLDILAPLVAVGRKWNGISCLTARI